MAHPTADKNFRLPTDIRPTRYNATLQIDPEAKTFSGTEVVDLELGRPSAELRFTRTT